MPGHGKRGGWLGGYSLGLALAVSACSSSDMNMNTEPQFEPLAPAAYTSKVKNLLTGLALTDAELQTVTADPTALAGLIDTWMALPQFDGKLLQQFQQAFQQTQLTVDAFGDQMPGDKLRFDNTTTANRFLKSMRESFARTALQVVKDGRPFSDVLTTGSYMLNTPLMSYMAYHDSQVVDDTGKLVTNRFLGYLQKHFSPPSSAVLVFTNESIPPSQSVDPLSANFMKWTLPGPPKAANFGTTCPTTMSGTNTEYSVTGPGTGRYMFAYLTGHMVNCGPTGATMTPQFTTADFDTWRMVTVRPPKVGEDPTPFWNLDYLRSKSELVISEPKIGFFTTPAFFANWSTNPSNQDRVTINQTLIVALNKSIDDSVTNNIPAVEEMPNDTAHASPGTICYACHKSLDPMKQFFRQSYTFSYSPQVDPAQTGSTATFAYDGVVNNGTGKGVLDLGPFLAAHPRFSTGWVQKLCYYANSAPCDETDPEFLRVRQAYIDSNFNYKTLIRELFSSPLVTLAAKTQTFADSNEPISISRREHFCVALSNRLGIADICGYDIVTPPALDTFPSNAQILSQSMPEATYSRGAESPALSSDPNLFFRAGVENLCEEVAGQLIDIGTPPRYSSTDPMAAIDDFVKTVMALPSSDARSGQARQILLDHYSAALSQAGSVASIALKSTFVLACTSPTSVSIGL